MTERPSEDRENNIGEKLKEFLVKLFPQWEGFITSILGSKDTDATPENTPPEVAQVLDTSRQERAELATQVFEDLERGPEEVTNIMRIPESTNSLPAWRNEGPKNSWVEHSNEICWCDHKGFLVSVPQVKWYLLQGFNVDEHENLEEFMDGYVVQATFLGKEIIGGVIPELRDRLQEAERLMQERGIAYGPNGIDTIHGYAYRAIGRDGTGRLSNHAIAAIDFSKNRRNQLINIPGGNFDDYMATVDYSVDFYNLMVETLKFRGFGSWVANRSNGNRDTMQFDLNPNSDGILTNTGGRPEDYLA